MFLCVNDGAHDEMTEFIEYLNETDSQSETEKEKKGMKTQKAKEEKCDK